MLSCCAGISLATRRAAAGWWGAWRASPTWGRTSSWPCRSPPRPPTRAWRPPPPSRQSRRGQEVQWLWDLHSRAMRELWPPIRSATLAAARFVQLILPDNIFTVKFFKGHPHRADTYLQSLLYINFCTWKMLKLSYPPSLSLMNRTWPPPKDLYATKKTRFAWLSYFWKSTYLQTRLIQNVQNLLMVIVEEVWHLPQTKVLRKFHSLLNLGWQIFPFFCHFQFGELQCFWNTMDSFRIVGSD